ncbi:hypothetical protein [Aggregatibacter actinomycetemcomitans]|nr:hypothetical protein [Aggregatibacter actinomycetemcomitans]MBN6062233.1 hypothetical protein [Aggregatibacter actinomycetemcomitans]MBN6073592.1 hypothetical protein [Aggregatibacter actinomycetemcomitans]UEL54029.1 hypothetical protein KO461_03230 [Aggregatibacter actinomycetemcomitans]
MPNHHRRRFAVAFQFDLCTLDGIIPRRCATRVIQRQLSIVHYQPDVMPAWFPLKLRPGLATVMNIFVIALVLGLTRYLPEKPTALYVCFAYAVIGILLFGIGTPLMFAFGIGRVVQYTLLFISRVPYFSNKPNHLR